MSQKKQNSKRRLTFKSWFVIGLWSMTLLGIAVVVAVFWMAKNEKLGPMPSFEHFIVLYLIWLPT